MDFFFGGGGNHFIVKRCVIILQNESFEFQINKYINIVGSFHFWVTYSFNSLLNLEQYV